MTLQEVGVRSVLGRIVLGALGAIAVILGVAAIIGLKHLDSRGDELIVGFTAVVCGSWMIRFATSSLVTA